MAAIVFVAIDCSVLRFPAHFAGCLLIGLAMQVGLFQLLRRRGRIRRFWAGFEATGLAALIAYIACLRADYLMIIRWVFYLFGAINGALSYLAPDAYLWMHRHLAI